MRSLHLTVLSGHNPAKLQRCQRWACTCAVPWTPRPVHTECPGPAISRLHPSWQELAQERAKSGCGSPGALSAACPTSAHHSPVEPPNCPNLKTLPGKCPSRNKPTHKTKKLHKVHWLVACLFIYSFLWLFVARQKLLPENCLLLPFSASARQYWQRKSFSSCNNNNAIVTPATIDLGISSNIYFMLMIRVFTTFGHIC